MSEQETIVYDLFHKGAIFEVDLKNCSDAENFSGTIIEQHILIYKPFGDLLVELATLESGTKVKYINGEANPIPQLETILDEVGYWEFAARIKLVGNDELQTSERQPFYVR